MRITVLTVPDCPNAPVVHERITRALEGRSAQVGLVEVDSQEQAARLGMPGSPTGLIDGADPFATPGAAASVSCRLYRGPGGAAEGGAEPRRTPASLEGADMPADCGCPLMDAAGRVGSQAGGLGAVQQAVLRHFAPRERLPWRVIWRPLLPHLAVEASRSWRAWRPRTSSPSTITVRSDMLTGLAGATRVCRARSVVLHR